MSDINLQQCDYDFWTRAAYWTVEEGVAISLGLNPKSKNLADKLDVSRAKKLSQLIELAKRAQKVELLDALPNPVDFLEWLNSIDFVDFPDALLRDDCELSFFLSSGRNSRGHWNSGFSFVDYKMSYEALEKVYIVQQEELHELRRENWEYSEEFDEDALYSLPPKPKVFEERQRKTMLRLLLAVAIGKYRFNPNLERSSVPKNIESTTDICGLNVTNETIRDYLKTAVSEFPAVLGLFEDKSSDE